MGFFAGRKNPCKSALTFLAIEAKTMRKVHGFFRPTKKTMQKCMDFFAHANMLVHKQQLDSARKMI
jgi:hypothetical protein